MSALIADGVAKRFDGIAALVDVNLEVEASSITGLIGPNGAGKSTIFNAFTCLVNPDAGRLYVSGREVSGASPRLLPELSVGRTFQTPRGFPSLSVLGNVEVAQRHARDRLLPALFWKDASGGPRERALEALARVGLESRANYSYESLSGGEQRMLELARVLVKEPRILLLDEPTAGLNSTLQDRLGEMLKDLRYSGVSTLIVEHNLGFLMSLADDVYAMDSGRVISHGDPDLVARDPAVIEAYIGGAAEDASQSQ